MTKAAEIVESARAGKDGGAILEMLEQLEQQIIELGAIKQAARDYAIANTNLIHYENATAFKSHPDHNRVMLERLRANNETLQYLKDLVLD